MKTKKNFLTKTIIPRAGLWALSACCWLVLLAFTPAASATDYVSTGSGAWSAAIWSPVGTPGAGDSAEISSGNAITSVASLNVGVLIIDATGTFTVGNSMTVGSLTNNGTLTIGTGTSARTLSITNNFSNNGTVNGDSSQQNAIRFNGNGFSAWTGSGDISGGKILLSVLAGTTLDISGLSTALKFRSSGTMASIVSGTLINGTQIINGNGNAASSFTLASGATLITANPNGLINGASGMFNFAGAVSLNTAANYTFNGTAAQVTLGLPATVNNLSISNAAGVTLSAATVINGTLALDLGVLISTAGNLPTVADVGTVTGVGNVRGPLAQVYSSTGAKTFLIGKGGNRRPVTLNYTALTGMSSVTVEQFESPMGGTPPAATTQFNTRYWAVSQTGGSGFTFNLSLDGTGFSPAATPVILREGSPDTSFSTSFASPNYTATGIAAFGNFALGDFAPSADKLVITTAPQVLTAGQLSGTITVQLQDSASTPKNAPSNLTVNLTTTSGGGVFRDTGDTTTISSVTITMGNNSASFKYRDTLAPGTPTITTSGGGVNSGTQIETINAGSASKLAFTTQPANGFIGNALAPIVAQVQDAFGNNLPNSGINVTLTLNGGTLASGTNPQATSGSGAATFNDLIINAPGTGLNFTATAGGLTSAVSSNFNVSSKIIVKALNNTPMDQTASWTGGVVPTAFDTAVINTTSVGISPNNNVEFGASASWYGVSVSNWAAATGYTIGGSSGGTLTLGVGGLVGTGANHTLTVNTALALGTNSALDWSGTGGSLVLNNTVDNGGYLLTLRGDLAINVANTVSGIGGLVKAGANTVTVNGTLAHAGSTTVSNGVLLIAGAISGIAPVTVAGGTLGGGGTISGPVTVQSGGTLAPGSSIGTLTITSDLTLQAGSVTAVEVNKDLASSDLVTGVNQANYGGVLTVANLSGTLDTNDTFTLFSAASRTGTFSSISGSPGAGLAWSFNPTNGQLSVVNGTASNPTNITFVVSGNTLTLSWPADHLGWILQSQTNALSVGLKTNWFDVAGSGSATSAVITNNPANPTVFFRLRSP